ncbi:MAG: hypothetical protein JNL82_26025 [Myxococcales bacterium]|nr:hypothetical protein [Myxococcales bacterium]
MARDAPKYAARLIAWADAVSRRVGSRGAIAGTVTACVGLLVAEDIGAAPGQPLRAGLAGRWVRRPELLREELAAAWRGLCAGHPALGGAAGVLDAAPTLTADEAAELAGLAELDWSAVEPAILGTLIERSLQADERARLGAYFTPRAFIERLARPTLVEPLADAWATAHAAARACVGEHGRRAAQATCARVLAELRAVRVLDPACGTGNFLYVALDLLRALEAEVLAALRGFGGEAAPQVQPDQLLGIETEARSRDVAALVLWLGFMRRGWSGPVAAGRLEVRDALLTWDRVEDVVDAGGRVVRVSRQGKRGAGTAAALRRYHGARAADWPAADFVVSNPPFIGNKRMRELLGDGYVEALRAAYAGAVPGDVDLVGYWWHKAAEQLRAGGLRRFGMITTNSVRQRQTGAVLRMHLQGDSPLVMHAACADHPWAEDDAAVRISMTVVRRADEPGAREPAVFDETGAPTGGGEIHVDLSAGVDLSRAVALTANRGLCFQGMNLVGDGFRLSEAEVRDLLGMCARPAVLRPYLTGREFLRAGPRRYVIDFHGCDLARARELAPQLLGHLERTVKALRDGNRRENYRRLWWQFGEPRPGLRRALAGAPRYVATAETSRHRVFVRLAAEVVPDHQLYAIVGDDAWMFAVLSARPHTTWALRAGGRNGAGNDPRWTSTRTFAPFPFPAATAAQRAEIRGLALALERARGELLARAGGSLTDLYNAAPAELRAAHARLDAAVLAAYGWAPELAEGELLARLVALNAERADEERRGLVRATGGEG